MYGLAATHLHPRDHRLWFGGRVSAVRACSMAFSPRPMENVRAEIFFATRVSEEKVPRAGITIRRRKHSLQVVQCPPLSDGDRVKDVEVAREPTLEVRTDC